MSSDFDLGTEWDISLDDSQDLAILEGAAETGQACGILLKTHEREYFLDQDLGPDYVGKVLTKPYRKASAEQHLRTKLRAVDGLRSIDTLNLTPDTADPKTLAGDYAIQSIYGPASGTI